MLQPLPRGLSQWKKRGAQASLRFAGGNVTEL